MKLVAYEKNKNFLWKYTADDIPTDPPNVMHYDSSMVITYLIKGTGSIFSENVHTDIFEGDIIIVSPNEFHRATFDRSSEHERMSIYVYDSLAETSGINRDLLFGIFFDRKPGVGNVIPARVAREQGIHALLESMQAPTDEEEDVILQCKILELLVMLKKAMPLAAKEKLPRRESKTTSAAIAYISEHLSEEISTSKIADALFLDKSYLCREFKKNTGATVNQYVTKKRLCTAIGLMANGVNCTEACYRSGFGNYSSFYKYYCRYTGVSPTETKIKRTARKKMD